jgi:hypothetical protein
MGIPTAKMMKNKPLGMYHLEVWYINNLKYPPDDSHLLNYQRWTSSLTYLHLIIYSTTSHGSAIGMATRYELEDGEVGVRAPVRSRIFTSPYRPDRFLGSFAGVKQPKSKADHSSPTTVEVNKTWICVSTPPRVSMEQC